MIRVLVADDSAFMRKALSQMIAADPEIQVVGTARDGQDAVELAQKLAPDIVTLDLQMPRMDGLAALREILRLTSAHVIIISSITTDGSREALKALSMGAADVLAKDNSGYTAGVFNLQTEITSRIRNLGRRTTRPGVTMHKPAAPLHTELAAFKPGQFELICIGSSTGGPPALEQLFTPIPRSLTVPIVVAQHMPPAFTASMAERLHQLCERPVVHADDGMPIEPGTIYIARGGRHIHIIRGTSTARLRIKIDDQPAAALYRPSVDALFASAALATGPATLAIVLTGIGRDGSEGAQAIRKAGGTIITQSAESCVVYGMPKAAAELGLSSATLDPNQIGHLISTLAHVAPK